jgi:hypothetical protein
MVTLHKNNIAKWTCKTVGAHVGRPNLVFDAAAVCFASHATRGAPVQMGSFCVRSCGMHGVRQYTHVRPTDV